MTLSTEGRAAMKEIAQETADKTVDKFRHELKDKIIPDVVKETMSNLGQDVSNQQDAQKDYLFLRQRRLRSEKFEEHKMKVITGGVVSVIFAALVAYFKGGVV